MLISEEDSKHGLEIPIELDYNLIFRGNYSRELGGRLKPLKLAGLLFSFLMPLIIITECHRAQASSICNWALSLVSKANSRPNIDSFPSAFLNANPGYVAFTPIFERFSKRDGVWSQRDNVIKVVFASGPVFDFELGAHNKFDGSSEKTLFISFTHEPLGPKDSYFKTFAKTFEKIRETSPKFRAGFESNTSISSTIYFYEGSNSNDDVAFMKAFFKSVTFRSPRYSREVKPTQTRFSSPD
jgi:hypothetical protein